MIQPVIKWTGSKRTQAAIIKDYLPDSFNTYYEPFIGGGAVMYVVNSTKAICGDICEPLIALWCAVRDTPVDLAKAYRMRWDLLQREGEIVYYSIRDAFNKSKNPNDLLFLSRTCVNGLIRFNANGEFNNSLHHTRCGINPDRLQGIIQDWSERIQGCTFNAADYEYTTRTAQKGDLVYLDPPYFNTKGQYYGAIDYNRFLEYLEDLNRREVKYILSFDGRRGKVDYSVEIPKELYKRHEYIVSGNSTFRKVMQKETERVYESLYLNY